MDKKLFEWNTTKDVFELAENDIFALAENIMGLSPIDIEARSESCKDILINGVKCDDFIGVRRFILCYAWSELEKKKTNSFKQAIDDAWAYARKYCSNI